MPNTRSGRRPAIFRASTRWVPSPSFTIHKATGVFGDDAAAPPHQYFEIIDIKTMDGFVADISTDEFQAAAAPFQDYADNPVFVLTEDL